jgi:hypothetical protein
MLLSLSLVIVAAAQAQPMRMTPQQRVDTLAKQLSLDDAQKAKVLVIFQDRDSSMRKAFAEHQGDRTSMRSMMDSLRSATDTSMKAVLTKDQYDAWQKSAQGGMRRGRRGEQ